MKVLITGVAGLIGSHLSRYLLDKGYCVIGIDNFFGGYEDFLPQHENFEFYKRSIETETIEDIYNSHKPEITYHLAAYAAEGLSPFIRQFNYQNNILGSINVINQCIKHCSKLIFTSSMAVYGNTELPYIESGLKQPIDPYGIAKLCVEMDIQQAYHQFDLQYNIVRPHNVIGIYQNIWDNYRNVVGIFIKKALDKKPLIVYGDGLQTRAFSDIKYCLPCFEQLIEYKQCDVFNIGADKFYTVNQIACIVQDVAKSFNIETNVQYSESRHEAKHAFCSHTKAKQQLNFIDQTNIEEVIYNMFVWAKKQPNRIVKKVPYELDKGIYSYWKDTNYTS